MRFTVFGGSGFIGSNLSHYLKQNGHEVFLPSHHDDIDKLGNLGNVIYAIGLTGNFRAEPYRTIDAHVTKLSRLIQKCNYDSWLYLSSTHIYKNSENTSENSRIIFEHNSESLYTSSKLLGEALCLSINNPFVRVARLSNVLGLGQSKHTFFGSLIADMNSGKDIYIRDHPSSLKDYIILEDVLWLLKRIVTYGKERIYNVASGVSFSHQEIANAIESSAGLTVKFNDTGKINSFQKIDISRINDEFGFSARISQNDFCNIIKVERGF